MSIPTRTRQILLLIPLFLLLLSSGVDAQDQVRQFRFVENIGQWPLQVRFAGQVGSAHYRFGVGRVDRTIRIVNRQSGAVEDVAIRTRFLRTSPLLKVYGTEPGGGKHHFYLGKEPEEHFSGADDFRSVTYRHLYDGIDMVYREEEGGLKYDIYVDPGARPQQITLANEGIEGLSVDPAGRLVMRTSFGILREDRPYSYQEIDGLRVEVDVRYRIINDSTFGFQVLEYDPSRPLVIDPCLAIEYLTFLGGGDYDEVTSMATDSSGFSYAVGITRASNFPTIPGTLISGPDNRVFVTKIAPDGRSLVYSVLFGPEYLGLYDQLRDSASGQVIGQLYEALGEDVEVDRSGRAVVGLTTNQRTLPATPTGYQPNRASNNLLSACGLPTYDNFDLFVMRLGNNGSVEWGTYLGGSEDEYLRDIALTSDGSVAITGFTVAAECGGRGDTVTFPVTLPDKGFTTPDDLKGPEAFVSLLSADGASLRFSALYGGSGAEYGGAIAVGGDDNLYILGSTNSDDLVTTTGAYRENPEPGLDPGVYDLYLARIDPFAGRLLYATYIPDNGGSGRRGLGVGGFARRPATGRPISGLTDEFIYQGLLFERDGEVVLGGSTRSTTLPVTGGVVQGANGNPGGGSLSGYDAFLIRFDMNSSAIRTATYLGGNGLDVLGGLARTIDGNIAIGVSTSSTNYPVTRVNIQDQLRGLADGALTVMAPGFNGFDFSTYVGGTAVSGARLWEQSVRGVSADSRGGIYLFGGTVSFNLPFTPDALNRTNDYFGGWIAKFTASQEPRLGAPLSITFPPEACVREQLAGALVFNGGTDPLVIDSITFARGIGYSLVNPPTFPLILGACDSITITIGFSAEVDTNNCGEVFRDTVLYYAANAVIPRIETPLVGQTSCVFFELRQTQVDDPRYPLGSNRGYNLLAFVGGDQTQFVSVEPAATNSGLLTLRGPVKDRPVNRGVTSIDFDVNATDTGRFCEVFYVTVEPCLRYDTIRICTYVTGGFFNIEPEVFDLGLIPCGEHEIPTKIWNTGNDTLEFRLADLRGPNALDVFYRISWDSIRKLAPGDTFFYNTYFRPFGVGDRRSEPLFATNERIDEEKRQIITARLDTLGVQVSTASLVGAYSDLLDFPFTYEIIRPGGPPLRELTLRLAYDIALLELDRFTGAGGLLEGWEVDLNQPVNGGRFLRLIAGTSGQPLEASGRLGSFRMRVLRGDSIETPIRVEIDGTSSFCIESESDSTALFRLSDECLAHDRLIFEGNRMLKPFYPNPSGPVLHIPFRVPEEGSVKIMLFDARGDMVALLVDQSMTEGERELRVSTSILSPGLYFCRMVVNEKLTDLRKVVISE